MKILGKVTPTVVAVAVSSVLAAGGGAYAAGQITSAQIKDHTISQADLTKRAVQVMQHQDLRDRQAKVQQGFNQVKGQVSDLRKSSNGIDHTVADLQKQVASLSDRVDKLEGKDGASAGAWENPNGTAHISSDGTSVDLVLEQGNTSGTSLENASIDQGYQAGQHIKFTYALKDGAAAANGSPRIFVVINGQYWTTMDNNGQTGYGTANGDGTYTVDVQPVAMNSASGATAPSGRISYAGVVYDNTAAPGTVTISNLSIGGHAISFK